jgi:hypothetical protein
MMGIDAEIQDLRVAAVVHVARSRGLSPPESRVRDLLSSGLSTSAAFERLQDEQHLLARLFRRMWVGHWMSR